MLYMKQKMRLNYKIFSVTLQTVKWFYTSVWIFVIMNQVPSSMIFKENTFTIIQKTFPPSKITFKKTSGFFPSVFTKPYISKFWQPSCWIILYFSIWRHKNIRLGFYIKANRILIWPNLGFHSRIDLAYTWKNFVILDAQLYALHVTFVEILKVLPPCVTVAVIFVVPLFMPFILPFWYT